MQLLETILGIFKWMKTQPSRPPSTSWIVPLSLKLPSRFQKSCWELHSHWQRSPREPLGCVIHTPRLASNASLADKSQALMGSMWLGDPPPQADSKARISHRTSKPRSLVPHSPLSKFMVGCPSKLWICFSSNSESRREKRWLKRCPWNTSIIYWYLAYMAWKNQAASINKQSCCSERCSWKKEHKLQSHSGNSEWLHLAELQWGLMFHSVLCTAHGVLIRRVIHSHSVVTKAALVKG